MIVFVCTLECACVRARACACVRDVVNTYNLNIEENELGSDSRQVPNIFINWSLGSLFPWIRKYNWNIKVIL